jgi:5-(carboxyamino)imidazole ribonucleotide synthase
MQTILKSDIKLGVLGGGQLGQMLIKDAIDLGIEVHVLNPESDGPCRNYSSYYIDGDFRDFETVYKFGKNKDVVTIEIESVNTDALAKLEEEGVEVFPQPAVIKTIQDKGLQKEFLLQHNFPTSAFYFADFKNNPQQTKEIKFPCIQKLRKNGYDGRGVAILNSVNDMDLSFTEPSIIEEKINIKTEIAVMAARNSNGDTVAYDAVEINVNEANMLNFLACPAAISDDHKQQVQGMAKKIIEKLNMVGLLAVEFFITTDDELLVNELSPRPHNSGHHTIEACYTSQYHQLLRAILNLPLGSTQLVKPAVMVNLLGAENHTGNAKYTGLTPFFETPGVYFHIYGKKQTKPFRKMGHVTIINDNIEAAKETAMKIKNEVKVIA